MNRSLAVSVGRIEPDLARQAWEQVQQVVTSGDQSAESDHLLCCIAVFGHGEGVSESIERVRRALGTRTPTRFKRHVAVRAAPSTEPEADTAGTLYINWLFRPGAHQKLIDEIYTCTLALAILAAVRDTPKARVTWPQDDEIAARVMTAAVPPQGRVQ